jgi:hypothetical protein
VGKVRPIPSERAHSIGVAPAHKSKAVVFDLMQPARASGRYLGADWLGRQNKTDWRYWSWRRFHRRGVPRHLRSPPSPLTEPLACRRNPADDCLGRKGKTVCRLGLELFFLFMADRVTVDMPSSKGILPLLATWPRSGGAHFCRQHVYGLLPVAGFNDRPAYFVPTQP